MVCREVVRWGHWRGCGYSHLVRVDQLLAGEVSVGAQLVYYNLVFRLDKLDILDSKVTFPSSRAHFFEALIEAIEGLVELPGDALYL